jgi:hypothetical protein
VLPVLVLVLVLVLLVLLVLLPPLPLRPQRPVARLRQVLHPPLPQAELAPAHRRRLCIQAAASAAAPALLLFPRLNVLLPTLLVLLAPALRCSLWRRQLR